MEEINLRTPPSSASNFFEDPSAISLNLVENGAGGDGHNRVSVYLPSHTSRTPEAFALPRVDPAGDTWRPPVGLGTRQEAWAGPSGRVSSVFARGAKSWHIARKTFRRLTSVQSQQSGSDQHESSHKQRCTKKNSGFFGPVLNPRSREVQTWNRLFLVSCVVATAVDPLFFYLVSISPDLLCVYIQGVFAVVVTVLRAITDLVYLVHMKLQLQLAYVSRSSLVLGQGELVSDPKKIARKYLVHRGRFLLDILVLLPIPQLTIFVILPALMRSDAPTTRTTTFLLLATIAQYVPKILRSFSLIRNMQGANGYVFGTANSGFALNFGAYIVAAHMVGACWYLFAVQRVQQCLMDRCTLTEGCRHSLLSCPSPVFYRARQTTHDALRLAWGQNSTAAGMCLQPSSGFAYGIYGTALPLVVERSSMTKVVYPLFWGLMSLSSFGNAMVPSNYFWEVLFSLVVILAGLLLFSMLIGNVQMFLISFGSRVVEMTQRRRDLDFWMRRRQLPSAMRKRVRRSERQRWAATRGINETSMVLEFPEGLRRDIKRHLCLELVRKVPLFEHMDDLLLDNICERLHPIMFIEGSQIITEGDPVPRMLFVMRGHIRAAVTLSADRTASCILGPGNFSGEELLTWCLGKRADNSRLPLSHTTLWTLDPVEGFSLAAEDLVYVTQHFRNRLQGKKLQRAVRHYSPHWRTWGAVTVQLAWRRYKLKKIAVESGTESARSATTPVLTRPLASFRGDPQTPAVEEHRDKDRLRMYTAMFMSPKPHDL